jgi:prepilin-type processing-associated H-X9-DG protein
MAHCQGNLKQIGIAFRTWDGDHGNKYPMSVFTNNGETKQFGAGSNLFRYFQVMSNQLNGPDLLTCLEDNRKPAADFASLDNHHLSYFVGLDADEALPVLLLSGDRNIVNGQQPINGILYVRAGPSVNWTPERHQGRGNILFSDGHVDMAVPLHLRGILASTGLATNRLAMP